MRNIVDRSSFELKTVTPRVVGTTKGFGGKSKDGRRLAKKGGIIFFSSV